MDQDLKQLLEENLVYSKEILKYARSTRRMLMFDQVMSVVKIVLIIVPLIFAYLYITPYLQQSIGMYKELLGNEKGINVEELLKK